MASAYTNNSLIFRNLNIVNLVSYNLATALWGANVVNSVLTILSSKHSFRRKLLVAWLCGITSVSQALTTVLLKKDYVDWGFIDVDSVGAHETLQNLISLVSAIVTISCQAFLSYEICQRTQQQALVLLTASLPLGLQLVPPLGSLISSPNSSWQSNRKEALLASLALKMIASTVICAALCVLWWRTYFSPTISKKGPLQSVMNGILFAINANIWVVIVGLSELVMFYYFYSYTSLFLLYSHVLSPLYFMTVLSILADGRTRHGTISTNDSNEPWSVARRSPMSPDGDSSSRSTQLTRPIRFHHSTNF